MITTDGFAKTVVAEGKREKEMLIETFSPYPFKRKD